MKFNYPGFAFASTILSNLIPLACLLTLQWSILSLLFLYWIETVWVVGLGIVYFLVIIQFHAQKPNIFTFIINWIIKGLFALILATVLGSILGVQLWLIAFSAIRRYEPQFDFAHAFNFGGHFQQIWHCLLVTFPTHLTNEVTLIIGILAILGNYLYILSSSYLTLSKTIDEMNLTTRFWSATVAVVILGTLNIWAVFDKKEINAEKWAFWVAIAFLVLKILYEIRVLVRKSKPEHFVKM
jgi:hypothetical protein